MASARSPVNPLAISTDLANSLSRAGSTIEIYELAERAVQTLYGGSHLTVWLWDEAKSRVFRGFPLACDDQRSTPFIDTVQSSISHWFQNNASASDLSSWSEPFVIPDETCLKERRKTSAAVAVSVAGLKVIFSLLVDEARYRPWDSGAVQLLAHLSASAIARLDLARANSVIAEVSSLTHISADQSVFFKSIVATLKSVFDAEGCSLFLVDGLKDRLVLAATSGIVDPKDNEPVDHVEYAIGEGCTGWIWKHRRTLRLIDVSDEAELRLVDRTGRLRMSTKSAERRSLRSGVPYSFLGSPIVLSSSHEKGERVIGIIRIHKESSEAPFLPSDQQLLETIASVLAPAIERWRIIGDMEWRLKIQGSLFSIIEAMHHDDDVHLDTVLDRIAQAACALFAAYAVIVFVRDPDEEVLILKKSAGAPLNNRANFRIPFGEGLSGNAAASGLTIMTPDVRRDQRYIEMLPDVRSEANVPIMFGDSCAGVLCIASTEPGRFRFNDRPTIELLEILGKQAAIALHRVEVLNEREQWRKNLIRTTEMLTASSVASGLAHELKNGLAVISGMAENLKRVPGIKMDKENVLRLERIKTESSALFTLTKRLMELSQVGEPRSELVYMNELIRKRLAILREFVDDKNMKLIDLLDPRLDKPAVGNGIQVLLDPRQIDQVLTNLILNAVDASFPRQNIEVATKSIDDNHVSFSVRDFGIGIPASQKRLIFKMFHTTKDHGFGVGLHVARLLVEKNHGGQIDFESKENKGTTFVVTLPITR